MFTCNNCGREFKRKEDRTRHLKVCDGKHFCLKCNKETLNKQFCSKSCASSFNSKGRKLSIETKRKISKSLGGEGIAISERIKEIKPYHTLGIPKRKKILWKEQGCKCNHCDYNLYDPLNGPYELHHIDGNHHNRQKNNEELLCCNCHNMTPNYRFKGRKHTQESKDLISKRYMPV
jgi:hypothetical protein